MSVETVVLLYIVFWNVILFSLINKKFKRAALVQNINIFLQYKSLL